MSDIKTMLPELSENQVKWLYRELRDSVIGADLPMEQPFDSDLDPVELVGNRLFRKGSNWTKAEIRAALSSFFGVEGED